MLTGKVILITGGTGSFGHAVVTRLLQTDCAQIRVFSRDEKKQEDMRLALANNRLKFHIGRRAGVLERRRCAEGRGLRIPRSGSQASPLM